MLSLVVVSTAALVLAAADFDLEKFFDEQRQATRADLAGKESVELEIVGEITERLSDNFGAELKAASAAKQITIMIDTMGGSSDAGRTIAQSIEKAAKRAAVTCIVDGQALSAGFYILQSCPVRILTKRSLLMAHEPWLGGGGMGGTHRADAIRALELIDAEARAYAEQCAARLTITSDEFLAKIRNRDWWISPMEAAKLGAVDQVVASPNEAMRAKPRASKKAAPAYKFQISPVVPMRPPDEK